MCLKYGNESCIDSHLTAFHKIIFLGITKADMITAGLTRGTEYNQYTVDLRQVDYMKIEDLLDKISSDAYFNPQQQNDLLVIKTHLEDMEGFYCKAELEIFYQIDGDGNTNKLADFFDAKLIQLQTEDSSDYWSDDTEIDLLLVDQPDAV